MHNSTFHVKSDAKRLTAKPRMRKCSECKQPYLKQKMGQVVCGPLCAQVAGRKTTLKMERATDKARKESIKTRSEWMKEAQVSFNKFIRERDRLAGYLCVSSGLPLNWNAVGGHQVDAGHFRSIGSAPHLRFDERNCHAQRVQDNRYGSGAAVEYRVGLIARIGLAEVEALEADQTPRKWSIDELKAIKALYKLKLKELKQSE